MLVDPSHEDLLATLGLPSALGTRACDVAIIGAGPAGLAAAVYAASEGLEHGGAGARSARRAGRHEFA